MCLTKKSESKFFNESRLNLFTNKKYVIKLELFALHAFRTFDFFFIVNLLERVMLGEDIYV